MDIDGYVDQILESPAYIFNEVIDKLTGKSIQSTKIELLRHTSNVDDILFEAIKSILIDLRDEEGIVSRFIYNNFGIKVKRNKRREQLLLLGSQLKTQHSKVKSELFRIYRHKERLSLSIIDLRRLKESFSRKNIYFQNEQTLNKTNFYSLEIDEKIQSIEAFILSLELKYNDLKETEIIYSGLLKKIPRYHELQQEKFIL